MDLDVNIQSSVGWVERETHQFQVDVWIIAAEAIIDFLALWYFP